MITGNGSSLTLRNLTIANGNEVNGAGINNNGTLTIDTTTVSGNTATTFDGGGIHNAGTLTITNGTFATNSAPGGVGGAIYNASGTLTITNSTFSGNSAVRRGGGIYINLGSLTVTSSTFSGNSARDGGGGGIFIGSGITTPTNTIIANSTGGDCDGFGTFDADSHDLADDASCGSATQKTSAQINLQPLASNGGPTQTFALGPGSAAIDTGAAVGSGPVGNPVLATDQRGKPRVNAPDIGAFENQDFTLTLTSGNNQSTLVNTAFANPLVVTRR